MFCWHWIHSDIFHNPVQVWLPFQSFCLFHENCFAFFILGHNLFLSKPPSIQGIHDATAKPLNLGRFPSVCCCGRVDGVQPPPWNTDCTVYLSARCNTFCEYLPHSQIRERNMWIRPVDQWKTVTQDANKQTSFGGRWAPFPDYCRYIDCVQNLKTNLDSYILIRRPIIFIQPAQIWPVW